MQRRVISNKEENMPATATPILQQAWAHFQQTLDEVRLELEATPRFQHLPLQRAKAYHVLMEVQAMAYNYVVAPRMLHPRLNLHTCLQTDVFTLAQNCQDFFYQMIYLDGRQRYRISGRMGDLSLILLQTFNGMWGESGVSETGNYDWADFSIDARGRFEVILSASREEGNWIPIDPQVGYQMILIRSALVDWHGDRGELRIDRISEIPDDHYDADEFDEAAMATRIRRAAGFVRFLIKFGIIGLYDNYLRNANHQKNVLALLPGAAVGTGASPSCNYAYGIFDLQDDEALIMEMDKIPDGAYWSFQLGEVWSRSLDFSSRQSSLNMGEIVVDGDGGFRVVIAHRDPGISNWLDPCGRREGTIVFRNYSAASAPVPSSRKVKFADLAIVLPADTRRITPAERKHAMERRLLGQRILYGD